MSYQDFGEGARDFGGESDYKGDAEILRDQEKATLLQYENKLNQRIAELEDSKNSSEQEGLNTDKIISEIEQLEFERSRKEELERVVWMKPELFYALDSGAVISDIIVFHDRLVTLMDYLNAQNPESESVINRNDLINILKNFKHPSLLQDEACFDGSLISLFIEDFSTTFKNMEVNNRGKFHLDTYLRGGQLKDEDIKNMDTPGVKGSLEYAQKCLDIIKGFLTSYRDQGSAEEALKSTGLPETWPSVLALKYKSEDRLSEYDYSGSYESSIFNFPPIK